MGAKKGRAFGKLSLGKGVWCWFKQLIVTFLLHLRLFWALRAVKTRPPLPPLPLGEGWSEGFLETGVVFWSLHSATLLV
jgi:hypothetical protein